MPQPLQPLTAEQQNHNHSPPNDLESGLDSRAIQAVDAKIAALEARLAAGAPAGSGGECGSEVIGSEFNAGGKRESTQTSFDTIRVGAQVPGAPTRGGEPYSPRASSCQECLNEWLSSPNPLKKCVAHVLLYLFSALLMLERIGT